MLQSKSQMSSFGYQYHSLMLLYQSLVCHSKLYHTILARHCNYLKCCEMFHYVQSIGLDIELEIQQCQRKSLL